MKRWQWILIGALILAVALPGGLYWLGGRTQVYRATIEIEAPREEVFRYLTDPARIPEWAHGVKEVRPLTEGGHRVGARALVIVEENGNRYELTDVVTESVPGQALEVVSDSKIFRADSRWQLAPTATGTRVELTMRTSFRGFFRLFAPLMKSDAEAQLQTDFETLKALIESNPTAPAPDLDSPPAPIDNTTEEPPPAVPEQREASETDNWMMT